MIDIHSHLLPGVDDGSPSVEVTLPVLERFGRDGVEVLVCTPHLHASEIESLPSDALRERLAALARVAPPKPALVMGWEIMLDQPDADLTARHLHLGDSTAALVEFSRMNVPESATAELFRIRTSGVIPVLAHPERYWGCTTDKVLEWRNAGAVIQMDAAMLLGRGDTAKLARDLLELGYVDCIASDNHGDSRSLAAARDWLIELGAEEQARLLTHGNPARLLASEAVIPVPPLHAIENGMVGRLRELIFGRR